MADLKLPPPPTGTGDAERVPDGVCMCCFQTRPRFRAYVEVLDTCRALCPRCWSADAEKPRTHYMDDR